MLIRFIPPAGYSCSLGRESVGRVIKVLYFPKEHSTLMNLDFLHVMYSSWEWALRPLRNHVYWLLDFSYHKLCSHTCKSWNVITVKMYKGNMFRLSMFTSHAGFLARFRYAWFIYNYAASWYSHLALRFLAMFSQIFCFLLIGPIISTRHLAL